MNSLQVLIPVFLILISLDLLFMLALHFFHDKTGYYKYAALIWLGMLMGLVTDTLTSPYGLHHIFGGPFLSTSAFFYGILISKLYENTNIPLKKLFSISVVGWVVGTTIHFTFDAPFWLSALFLVGGGGFTYIYIGVKIWSVFERNRILEKVYATALILEGIHLLDYPFVRNIGDRVFITEFGFGSAIVLAYFTSILNPVLINRKISANLNNILKKRIDEKVSELQSVHILLQENRKMAALGEMAGGIAHEINTPIGAILLRANQVGRILEQSQPNLEQAKEFSRSIVETCHRIADIVSGLDTFAVGGEKDPFEPKKIKDIVTDALALCSERLKNHGVKLKLRQIPDQLNIECRSQQISQVILNLILNAKQALTLIPDDKWIMIEAKDIGSEVIITITDNGVGIAEDVRPKILEPFFTTKQIGDGPGLGLSISKGIIEDHGGRLYLDETQEYTTFVIQIPKTQKRKNLVA